MAGGAGSSGTAVPTATGGQGQFDSYSNAFEQSRSSPMGQFSQQLGIQPMSQAQFAQNAATAQNSLGGGGYQLNPFGPPQAITQQAPTQYAQSIGTMGGFGGNLGTAGQFQSQQPQQPAYFSNPEFQGYRTQYEDLNRQMNDYMRAAPMYQQMQELQTKMRSFEQPQAQMMPQQAAMQNVYQQRQMMPQFSGYDPMQRSFAALNQQQQRQQMMPQPMYQQQQYNPYQGVSAGGLGNLFQMLVNPYRL